MNDDEKINRVDELLPRLNQQEKIGVIAEIAFLLQGIGGDPSSDTEREFLTICESLDESHSISVIQSLANRLVK